MFSICNDADENIISRVSNVSIVENCQTHVVVAEPVTQETTAQSANTEPQQPQPKQDGGETLPVAEGSSDSGEGHAERLLYVSFKFLQVIANSRECA